MAAISDNALLYGIRLASSSCFMWINPDAGGLYTGSADLQTWII